MLVEVARRLSVTARSCDTAGRFGGDEFVVVAHPVPGCDDAAHLAERVLRSVCRPVKLQSGDLVPSLSIGAALSAPGEGADSLPAAADQALYAA